MKRQRLKHSEVHKMTPVKGWELKVKKLSSWINANYNRVILEGVSESVLHTVYIQLHNRLKYTNWTIKEGGYSNLIFSACYKQFYKQKHKENKYTSLAFDVPCEEKQHNNTAKQLDTEKVKVCAAQLTGLRHVAFRESFIHRRSITESAKYLGVSYMRIYRAHYGAIDRVAQLYKKELQDENN